MIRYEVFSDHFAQRINYLTEVDTRVKMFFVAAAIIIVVSSQRPYAPLIAFFFSLVLLLGIRIPIRIILLRLAAPLGTAGAGIFIPKLFFWMAEGPGHG